MTTEPAADAPATLITGGAGHRAATTRRLLEQGHRVTITGRDQQRLDRFAQKLDDPAAL